MKYRLTIKDIKKKFKLWGCMDLEIMVDDNVKILYELAGDKLNGSPITACKKSEGCGKWVKTPNSKIQSEHKCGEHDFLCPDCKKSSARNLDGTPYISADLDNTPKVEKSEESQ